MNSRLQRGRKTSRRSIALQWPSVGTLLVMGVAVLVGAAAFSTAIAGVGLPLGAFKNAGPAFYPHLRMVDARDAGMIAKPVGRAKGAEHLRTSRTLLTAAPLSSDVARSLVLGLEASGDSVGATAMTTMAGRLSRRDGFVQMRLARSAIERGEVRAGIVHFDNYLRTYPPGETDAALMQMVAILPFADARRELAPYVTADNVWLDRFVGSAVGSVPKAADLAELLLLAQKVPDGELLRPHYMKLFDRLIKERAYAQAIQLYPKLPGTSAKVLASVAVTPESVSGNYMPAAWALGDSSDWGGSPVETAFGTGIEFFAQPDTIGIAGRKLVRLPNDTIRRSLYWVASDKQANPTSRANFKLTCGATQIRSVNILAMKSGVPSRMALPEGCRTLLLEFEIFGGIGREPAQVVIDRLSIRTATAAPRAGG
jgi:hypothetical protein